MSEHIERETSVRTVEQDLETLGLPSVAAVKRALRHQEQVDCLRDALDALESVPHPSLRNVTVQCRIRAALAWERT